MRVEDGAKVALLPVAPRVGGVVVVVEETTKDGEVEVGAFCPDEGEFPIGKKLVGVGDDFAEGVAGVGEGVVVLVEGDGVAGVGEAFGDGVDGVAGEASGFFDGFFGSLRKGIEEGESNLKDGRGAGDSVSGEGLQVDHAMQEAWGVYGGTGVCLLNGHNFVGGGCFLR